MCVFVRVWVCVSLCVSVLLVVLVCVMETSESISPEERKESDLLYLVAKDGSGDDLKAELERQNITFPIDEIRVSPPGEPMFVEDDDFSSHKSPKDVRKTLLQVASSHGNASCVKALLAMGSSPRVRTTSTIEQLPNATYHFRKVHGEETSLHLAAKADRSSELIDLLIRSPSGGTELVDARSANGCTALMLTATRFSRLMKNKESK